MAENKESNKPTMQTVDRALVILNLLSTTSLGLSAIEISKAMNITRTTTYNMLNSLMADNYVERDEKTGRYYIGYRFLEIGSLYRFRYPFATIAERYLSNFDSTFQANVCVYKPPMRVLQLIIRTSPLVNQSTTSRTMPAYATACGKALLAAMPDDKLCELLAKSEYRKYTKKTIDNADDLYQELLLIRERGYARETEELLPGRSCIGAVFRDMSGEVLGAISLGGETAKLDEQMPAICNRLLDTVRMISAELGYRYDYSAF